jgi:hypothetical protein
MAVNAAARAVFDASGGQQSWVHTSRATPGSCCKSLDCRQSHSACTPRPRSTGSPIPRRLRQTLVPRTRGISQRRRLAGTWKQSAATEATIASTSRINSFTGVRPNPLVVWRHLAWHRSESTNLIRTHTYYQALNANHLYSGHNGCH